MTSQDPVPTNGTLVLPAGYRLVRLDRVDSTNTRAKELAAAGAPHGTLVLAKTQTAGRGRRGRLWASPPGNLYASLILRPACAPPIALEIGFVAALALGDGLVALAPDGIDTGAIRYKWPNDVLIDGRKVGGILLESATGAGGSVDWLVVGVGVNVASHPDGTAMPAADLHAAGYTDLTVPRLLESFAVAFEARRSRWAAAGFDEVRRDWLARAYRLGEPVRVGAGADSVDGTFVDLGPDGALIVEPPGGARRSLAFGDLWAPSGAGGD